MKNLQLYNINRMDLIDIFYCLFEVQHKTLKGVLNAISEAISSIYYLFLAPDTSSRLKDKALAKRSRLFTIHFSINIEQSIVLSRAGGQTLSTFHSTTLKNLTLIKLHSTKQYTLDFTMQGGQTL